MVCSEEDKILIKSLYQLKEYKATDKVNEWISKQMVDKKLALTGCCWKSSGTLAQSTDSESQIVADHDVPHSVNDLLLSQEDTHTTDLAYRKVRENSRVNGQTGIRIRC